MVTETLDGWSQLREMLKSPAPSGAEIEQFLDLLPSADVLPAVFHLTTDEQRALLALISAGTRGRHCRRAARRACRRPHGGNVGR